MKNLFLLSTLLTLAFSSVLAGEFRVGTVRMRDLLNNFHETKAANAEADVERANLKKKDAERMTAITALQEEMKQLRAEAQDPSLAKARRQKVATQFGEKEQNLRMLGRERDEFLQRSQRALQEKMGAKLDDLRNKVVKAVQDYSATQEIDYVFDRSGLTTAQTPFVLYAREPIDLTEGVMALLNKDAPAESKKPSAEKAKK